MSKIRCLRRPGYNTEEFLFWNYPDLDDYYVDMVPAYYCNNAATYMVL